MGYCGAQCNIALLMCIWRHQCPWFLVSSRFTRCLSALAGKRWPSAPDGCLVPLWVGRSFSAQHTSCTSESNMYCSGFLHTSPGSNTHHSVLVIHRGVHFCSWPGTFLSSHRWWPPLPHSQPSTSGCHMGHFPACHHSQSRLVKSWGDILRSGSRVWSVSGGLAWTGPETQVRMAAW